MIGTAAMAALATMAAQAQEYETRVVAAGLERPTGIVLRGSETIFFTEVPTPGVPGSEGGRNGVRALSLEDGSIVSLNDGEPEPLNLALSKNGDLYWTCRSAGVVLERAPNGAITPFLGGLERPTGIAVARDGEVYFTQVPTPGVPGSLGGTNTVNVSDGSNVTVLTTGEPEPTDIAVASNGDTYWTCKSAGVILRRSAAGVVGLFRSGLASPNGIAIDHKGEKLYYTEVPTPGVSGAAGGANRVTEIDLSTGASTLVDFGDPEPSDIAVARNGNLYWTCSSAGVIVEAKRREER
jgi:sugar lactone lactonase YvrE